MSYGGEGWRAYFDFVTEKHLGTHEISGRATLWRWADHCDCCFYWVLFRPCHRLIKHDSKCRKFQFKIPFSFLSSLANNSHVLSRCWGARAGLPRRILVDGTGKERDLNGFQFGTVKLNEIGIIKRTLK